jgi:hypothetical protein
VAIGDYSIAGYWWLLIGIILMVIGDYYINGYWWIFCYWIFWLLKVIILVAIDDYSNGY